MSEDINKLREAYIEEAKALGVRANPTLDDGRAPYYLAAQQDVLAKLLQLDIAIVSSAKECR